MVLFALIVGVLSLPPKYSNQPDSLPPLHTLNDEDIKTVSASFQTSTLTVVLKNDTVLLYAHTDWDFEDYNPSTPKQISDAISSMERTFTKMEEPPRFPGGENSLAEYVKQFCMNHAQELKYIGHGDVSLSFVVHLKGQRCNYLPVGDYSEAKFKMAVKCISEGPDWISAKQNGHKVTAYTTVTIHLN